MEAQTVHASHKTGIAIMTPRWRSLLRRFWRDERGNYSILISLLSVPLLLSVGAAVDLSRAQFLRARLAQAVDSAGLAVGSAVTLTSDESQALGQRYFNANFPLRSDVLTRNLSLVLTDQVVTLEGTATVRTTFLAAFGIATVPLRVSSEITRESKGLEVVMVLDNTGSMGGGGKIGALRVAATDLVSILFGSQSNPDHLHIGLVPFVTSVNIRGTGFDMSWIDTEVRARYHGVNFDTYRGSRVSHLLLFDGIRNTEWKGCVEARPEPYDTLDTPPDPDNPDTRWVPYFWPDEPDGYHSNYYSNNYLNDATGGSAETRQKYLYKYNWVWGSIDETPSSTRGPNKSCADPLVPLTNDRQHLLNRIDVMRPWNNSGTNIALGLAWGWRVLSPGAPFSTGSAYDDPETQKALILLTDGENIVVNQHGHNDSDYTGYGYLNEARLGTTNRSTAASRINDKVALLCTRIKSTGVRLYTITFQLNSSTLRTLFRNCASEPSLYYDSPSNEDLRAAFRSIAQDLSNLRISR